MTDDGMPPGFGPDDPTAPDITKGEYRKVAFKATEFAPEEDSPKAAPWIMLEIERPGLRLLGDVLLGFECRDGVTLEEVSRLTHEMHRLIEGVSCTKFVT